MAKKRFVQIYYAGVFEQQRVYVDTLTGVNYLLLICNTNNMGPPPQHPAPRPPPPGAPLGAGASGGGRLGERYLRTSSSTAT